MAATQSEWRAFEGARLGVVRDTVEPWRTLSVDYRLVLVDRVDTREGPGANWVYRRQSRLAAQGHVMLLAPDELMCIPERTPAADLRIVVLDAEALGVAFGERAGLAGCVLPDLPTAQTRSRSLAAAIRALHAVGADPLADPLARETAALGVVNALAREQLVEHAGARRVPAMHGLDGRIDAVRDAIHDCPARRWKLAELADIARIDRFALVREFKRRHGAPPHAYHLEVRLACARKLLERGHHAGDVAPALGFADQAHMTRLFRRNLRTTPAAYAQAVSLDPAGRRVRGLSAP